MKTAPNKTGFSFLRFSVRFLLLTFFLAACLLGWMSWKIQAAKAELRLAREFEAAGHEVGWSHFEDGEGVWPKPGWNYNWLRNHQFSHVSHLHLVESDIASLESLESLTHLTELYLDCRVLTDITGVQQFPNLKVLNLDRCELLEDLQSITSLKQLQFLQLTYCRRLTKIEAIGECEKLESLDIYGCESVEDLSFISHLKHLRSLFLVELPHARIAVNTFANAPQLQDLEIFGLAAISDLDQPADLPNLESVSLGDLDSITNVDWLTSCKCLRELTFCNCQALQNVDGVLGATDLRSIELRNCPQLRNINGLRNHASIRSLEIESNELTDVSGLSGMTGLRRLSISSDKLETIEPVGELNSLKTIILNCQNLKSLECFADVTSPTQLHATSHQLTSLRGIEGMLLLDDVSFCSQTLSDIEALKNKNRIWRLDLNCCPSIENLDPLANLNKVKYLNLYGCKSVKDLFPITTMTSLVQLNATGVPVEDLRIFETLEQLLSLDVGHSGALTLKGADSLSQLNLLSLEGFDSIESFDGLSELVNLKRLTLRNCAGLGTLKPILNLEKLESLRLCDIEGKIEDMELINKLPSLTKLVVQEVPWLKDLDFFSDQSTIKSLTIENCDSLVDLSGLNKLSNLLQRLKVDGCDAFDQVDVGGLDRICRIDLTNCKSLKTIRGINGFHSLHTLNVTNNESLESLGVVSDLPALIRIDMNDCPKLKKLKVTDCDNLQVGWSIEFIWSLEEVFIERCNSPIELIDFGFHDGTSLKKVTIKNSGVSEKEANMFRICHPEIELIHERVKTGGENRGGEKGRKRKVFSCLHQYQNL